MMMGVRDEASRLAQVVLGEPGGGQLAHAPEQRDARHDANQQQDLELATEPDEPPAAAVRASSMRTRVRPVPLPRAVGPR